jgi:hypothetical protein
MQRNFSRYAQAATLAARDESPQAMQELAKQILDGQP